MHAAGNIENAHRVLAECMKMCDALGDVCNDVVSQVAMALAFVLLDEGNPIDVADLFEHHTKNFCGFEVDKQSELERRLAVAMYEVGDHTRGDMFMEYSKEHAAKKPLINEFGFLATLRQCRITEHHPFPHYLLSCSRRVLVSLS